MHLKYNNNDNSIRMMETSIDEQIKALQAKRKEQNRTSSRTELIRLAKSNATDEQLLKVAYAFIGSHRPIGVRKKKVVV